MIKKIWEYRDKQLKSEEVSDFSKKFNLPYELAVLLLLRGVKKMSRFFRICLKILTRYITLFF